MTCTHLKTEVGHDSNQMRYYLGSPGVVEMSLDIAAAAA